jgi:pimeloyl-ACP methyl ester carboxylesterase
VDLQMKLNFVVVVFSFLMLSCSSREVFEQQEKITRQVLQDNPNVQHDYLSVGEHTLHYVSNGQKQKPALIIIHGTPGDWQQYSRYLFNEDLLSIYRVIVIDRPGWGDSVLGREQAGADFPLQAGIIAALAKVLREQSQNQPVVLMGHSLGSSLAPQIALDFPELIDGLLLFAGTLDPELAQPRWFNYLATLPFAPMIIGDELSRANQEIFALEENVKRMSERFQELTSMTIVVQGMKDELVYPANIDFAEEAFNIQTTTFVRLENEGHLFPMTRPADVVLWASSLLKKINQQASPLK